MTPKEYEWFLQHSEIEKEYLGEYIAIVGETIVSHGKDFREVFQEAKKYGEEPYIHKVSSKQGALVV